MSLEVHDGVTAGVGRMQVRRALPLRRLRTGASCFADHMGPAEVTETAGLAQPGPALPLQSTRRLQACITALVGPA